MKGLAFVALLRAIADHTCLRALLTNSVCPMNSAAPRSLDCYQEMQDIEDVETQFGSKCARSSRS